MSQQMWFNLYVYVVVSIFAQSILAWELGYKGIEKLINTKVSKKVIFAFFLLLIQGLWLKIAHLKYPIKTIYDCWPLLIAIGVYIIARIKRP